MKLLLRVLCGVIISVLALGTFAFASTEWAVTSSLGKVFLVKNSGGTLTSSVVAELDSSSLTGIATYGNYVFVADGASNSLRVGKIINSLTPTLEWIGEPIQLKQGDNLLKQPGSVVVDASGGVYVLGGRWNDGSNVLHSNYAYVTPSTGWTQANVAIVDLPTTTLADIATTGDGAIIANRDMTSSWADQTCVTGVSGANAGTTALLDDGGYYPRGIALGDNGLAYVANYSTEVSSGAGPTGVGSVSVVNTGLLGSAGSPLQLGSFRPTDIAYFSIGELNYLGLVGVTSGGLSQAWRLVIGLDGLPTMTDAVNLSLGSSNNHFCSVSSDGSILWVTNPQANTIMALNTVDWTSSVATVNGAPSYIAAINLVPEPSSVIALLVGGIGLLGLRKRRR